MQGRAGGRAELEIVTSGVRGGEAGAAGPEAQAGDPGRFARPGAEMTPEVCSASSSHASMASMVSGRRPRFRETTRTPTNKSRHKTRRRRRETTNTRKTQERRWKAWWAGQGHPTCVNNTNLERYIPDCPVDVSYDAEVSQELHGPDNLPRLEEEDDEDEDDLLLKGTQKDQWDAFLPKFEDEGLGPGLC